MISHPHESNRIGWLLAVVLSGTLTLTQQMWVGTLSIYQPERRAVREMLHESILANRMPDSIATWTSIGANGLGVRPLAVWTAEGIHRLTGWNLHRSYLVLETMGLFAGCLLLCAFLQPLTGWPFAIGSLLYWGSVLPLTYALHSFHPWDKPGMALWLLALICARQRRWWQLAIVLTIGMLTKFDIIVFPILLLLAFVRTESLSLTIRRSVAFLLLTVTIYALLRLALPNGVEPRSIVGQVRTNFTDFRDTWYYYPPFLALVVPAGLAALGYGVADRFAKACVQLAVIVTGILFLQVNFIEFRAQVPLLVLLLPAAWYGLRRVSGDGVVPASVTAE